jgi:hypothetical protein
MTFQFTHEEYVILQTALEQASLHLQDLSNKVAGQVLTEQEARAKSVASSVAKKMIVLSTRLNGELQTSMLEEIVATRII